MPLSPTSRLGTYEILGPLGAGGMGEVYRARDVRLDREVAIKVLPSDLASSPDEIARLEREARTVARLNHPNIVTLFSVEDVNGIRFLTMELVQGQTLSTLVTPDGLPLPRLLEMAIPLSDALVAAHEKGVIHRDLKPGNVMVTRDGRVKVLDFGLAKTAQVGATSLRSSLGALADAPLTRDGEVTGTVQYLAPERLRGEAADARSDLFALGVILYELAAGRRPFVGATAPEVGSSILYDSPEPLSRLRADLPGEFGQIVDRCLEKDPRQRIQTALDLNVELRRIRKVLERGEQQKHPQEKAVSIAVLPFVNRSASADDEYFSDGLADELLTVLAKIKGLRVTARTSSFHFKGKDATIGEIGRTLDVDTVLEGSFRKSGNRVRISVQLVSVADSSQLWSETYDRTLDDIFAVQDDIARSVVKELRTTLLGEELDSDASRQAKTEVARAMKGHGTDPEAQRLYLLARHFQGRWTREDTAKAIEYLKQALDRDPEYALAWVELGAAYAREAGHGWSPVANGYAQAREAAQRALASEPDLAEAHVVMGTIRWYYDWDFRGAEEAYGRALRLSPANAEVLRLAGSLAWSLGHIEEGIGLLRRALEQDPLSAQAYHNLGSALIAADRFQEAEEACRKALELAPQRAITHAALSLALLGQGRGEEARNMAMQEPIDGLRLWSLGIAYGTLRQEAEWEATIAEMIAKYSDTWAYQIAEVCWVHGEADRAFEWLERAYSERDSGVTEMKTSPRFRTLHGDPRWPAFLKRMGLAD